MNKKNVISTLLAAVLLAGSSAALAQPHRPDDHDRGHGPRGDHRPPGHDRRDFRPDPPPARWHKGDRVPSVYRGRQYIVEDWRGHHLRQPPRGYHWISSGADYFLIGIATGAVLESVLN
jgi:Ni/Co efflux regulator RcnB